MSEVISTIITDTTEKVKERIAELQPIVQEHDELQDFLDRLTGPNKPSRRASRSSGSQGSNGKTRRSRSDGPNRSEQFLDALNGAKDGLTVSEVADAINTASDDGSEVTANYLYRVRDSLKKDGLIGEGKKDSSFILTKAGEKHIEDRDKEPAAAESS